MQQRTLGRLRASGRVATHALLSVLHCRLREHHRATIKVIRRMQYFVAKKKFQVSPASSPLPVPQKPSHAHGGGCEVSIPYPFRDLTPHPSGIL